MSDTNYEAEQPHEGQVPESQATAEHATAQGSGPWANDLAAFDEGVRGQVDEFLRGKVQPHVTRLEQDLARYKPAHQLYDDLTNNPQETYIAVTRELFGEEAAQSVAQTIGADVDSADDESDEYDENVDPRLAKLLEREERREAEELYNSEIARIKAQDPELDEQEFAPFVAAAEGNFDHAYTAYQPWRESIRAKYGPPAPVEPEPPAALGSQGSTTAPPVQKTYDTLDVALDETLAEMRANRNPVTPVGAV